jgi:hypothetical protein
MWSQLKPRSIYDVMAMIGCVAAIGTGTAYAANTVFSTDIVDGEVKAVDLGANSVGTNKISDGAVGLADLAADSVDGTKVLDSSLTGFDIANSSLTGSDLLDESLGTTDIADGGLNTSDLAISSVTGSRIAASAVTTSDIANRTVNMDDIDGADRSGSISVGAISNGRCVTITGSVGGTRPGDAAVLTTNGTIPNGMTIQAQRALTDAVHIKVCNLTGATSAAITDLPVRVITFH